jgi:hypothetical protein
MINSLLIIVGIIFLAISVFQCIRIIRINPVQSLLWQWCLMLCLIIFFIFGYVGFYYLSFYYLDLQISTLLIKYILFFGSIFVISMLSISHKLIESLIKKTMELNQANDKSTEDTSILVQKKGDLENAQGLLKKKDTES